MQNLIPIEVQHLVNWPSNRTVVLLEALAVPMASACKFEQDGCLESCKPAPLICTSGCTSPACEERPLQL